MNLPSLESFLGSKNIENDFLISLQCNDLPIDYSPCRINVCLVCLCLVGNADIEVDLLPYHFEANDILVVFPGQILDCKEKSIDFALNYFSFSNFLIDDIMYRFPSAFVGFLKENVTYHLPEKEKSKIVEEYFSMLYIKYCDVGNVCRSEIILNLLHNFYLDLYNKVVANNQIYSRQRKHKKELLEEFFHFVGTHPENREVAFYAEKLCITPKYLSIITKESVGTSAKELIDKFAVTELKLRLKTTSMPLKEIAEKLSYPSEAFLCKFFKRHTGMTLSHFRNTSR